MANPRWLQEILHFDSVDDDQAYAVLYHRNPNAAPKAHSDEARRRQQERERLTELIEAAVLSKALLALPTLGHPRWLAIIEAHAPEEADAFRSATAADRVYGHTRRFRLSDLLAWAASIPRRVSRCKLLPLATAPAAAEAGGLVPAASIGSHPTPLADAPTTTAMPEHEWVPVPRTPVAPSPRAAEGIDEAERFPDRALWLAEQKRQRGNLTNHRIGVLDGPNKHTVKKILAGDDVSRAVLERLAKALTDADPTQPVTVDDIPRT